jgi:uncharacterized damage-inducible protein DinB
MAHEFTTDYLADALAVFRQYKKLAEKAMAQLSDEDFFRQIGPESNSIAVIVKHLAGNMRSRWTDFLTTDGEKPDRHRDQEFLLGPATTRAQVMEWWETGWQRVFAALEPLTAADLDRKVFIRTEPHSVMQAINRQLAHYPNHIGQIIYLARHFKGDAWQTVTIPKNQSAQFNDKVEKGLASQR